LEVLLHIAQRCKAQAQETVLFVEWGRGDVERGSVCEGVTNEIQQGDDGADEVELDDGSP